MDDTDYLNTIVDIETEGFDAANPRHQKTLQALIDSGLVWSFHGWWGRLAQAAINAGICTINEPADD